MLFQSHHLLYILTHPDPIVGLYPRPRHYMSGIWDHCSENMTYLRHQRMSWKSLSMSVCSNFIHLLVFLPRKRALLGQRALPWQTWRERSCSRACYSLESPTTAADYSCKNHVLIPCTNSQHSCYYSINWRLPAAPEANTNWAFGFTHPHSCPFMYRLISWLTTEPQIHSVQHISNVHHTSPFSNNYLTEELLMPFHLHSLDAETHTKAALKLRGHVRVAGMSVSLGSSIMQQLQ